MALVDGLLSSRADEEVAYSAPNHFGPTKQGKVLWIKHLATHTHPNEVVAVNGMGFTFDQVELSDDVRAAVDPSNEDVTV